MHVEMNTIVSIKIKKLANVPRRLHLSLSLSVLLMGTLGAMGAIGAMGTIMFSSTCLQLPVGVQ
jgi:hypothetical protein